MEPSRPERLEGSELVSARQAGALAAAHFALPLARRSWVGRSGQWDGVGRGTSLEFQDHRPYHPGDDPRRINWQAYARSGALTMKLFREEVTPSVDLVLDSSASMRLHPAKWRRGLEAFFFAREAAARAGASVRSYLVDAVARLVDTEHLEHEELPAPAGSAPVLERIRFARGSLRLVVSDVLFPEGPEHWLRPLVERGGRGVVLAPFAELEEDPDWHGEVELVDCETRQPREQVFDPAARSRYRDRYGRHLDSWREAARRFDVVFARLSETGSLGEALLAEPSRAGAVEVSR